MKKIYKLSITYFSGPFVVTFFLCLFVLLMQFLWKYVDELVGKGLDFFVIGELLFYASAALVPMALPLSILVSSMMTMGNLSENNELMAFKSAGVPVFRVLRSLGIIIIIIAGFAFLFSNYILPRANLKFTALLYDIQTKKPTFDISEGTFYNRIDGYSIRIGKKNDETKEIRDVLIYDHSSSTANNVVIKAESGRMIISEEEYWLKLVLYNGQRYEEIKNLRQSYRSFPHSRIKFKEYEIRFDLSSFKFSRSNISLFKGSYRIMNMNGLSTAADSMSEVKTEIVPRLRSNIKPYLAFLRKEMLNYHEPRKCNLTNDTLILNFPENERRKILSTAMLKSRYVKHLLDSPVRESEILQKNITRFNLEWHRKLTLSFSVVILFLLGAPLGAIIRRGGLGMPTVISIFLFIGYYIISIIGEKLTKGFVLTPLVGMWMPTIVLLPIAVFLSHNANTDAMIFSNEGYLRLFNSIKYLFKKKAQK